MSDEWFYMMWCIYCRCKRTKENINVICPNRNGQNNRNDNKHIFSTWK